MLVGAVLGLDLTGVIAAANRRLTSEEAARLEDFARRRLDGEPVARILGTREFWGLPLKLSAATLVPRPDTETVVELALEMLRAAPRPNHRCRIADIGTGSGAILLALLSEFPGARGIGTDISEQRCRRQEQRYRSEIGRSRRLRRLRLCGGAVRTVRPDRLQSALYPLGGNRRPARRGPRSRSACGAGRRRGRAEAYRALIPQAAGLLAPGGVLVVEAGQGQSGDIQGLMATAGLTLSVPARADLAGIRRAVAGRKLPP